MLFFMTHKCSLGKTFGIFSRSQRPIKFYSRNIHCAKERPTVEANVKAMTRRSDGPDLNLFGDDAPAGMLVSRRNHMQIVYVFLD